MQPPPTTTTTKSSQGLHLQVRIEPKRLKYWASLKCLSISIMVVGLLLIIFDSIAQFMMSIIDHWPGHLRFYSGIWVGMIGAMNGGLGVAAFGSKYGQRKMIRAYFLMAILLASIDAFLIYATTDCLRDLSRRSRQFVETREQRALKATYVMESLMLIAAAVQCVCCIISTTLVCRNWGCGYSEPKKMAYVTIPVSKAGKEAVVVDFEEVQPHIATPMYDVRWVLWEFGRFAANIFGAFARFATATLSEL